MAAILHTASTVGQNVDSVGDFNLKATERKRWDPETFFGGWEEEGPGGMLLTIQYYSVLDWKPTLSSNDLVQFWQLEFSTKEIFKTFLRLLTTRLLKPVRMEGVPEPRVKKGKTEEE